MSGRQRHCMIHHRKPVPTRHRQARQLSCGAARGRVPALPQSRIDSRWDRQRVGQQTRLYCSFISHFRCSSRGHAFYCHTGRPTINLVRGHCSYLISGITMGTSYPTQHGSGSIITVSHWTSANTGDIITREWGEPEIDESPAICSTSSISSDPGSLRRRGPTPCTP